MVWGSNLAWEHRQGLDVLQTLLPRLPDKAELVLVHERHREDALEQGPRTWV